jgi:hypothetical protein
MAVLKNRAKMSTSTTGTGTITLGSAESGFQTFADAGVSNGNVVRYVIEDGNNFEIGTGTYTSSGTTLSRTVSESNNSNNAINLSGSATVFISAIDEDIVGGPRGVDFDDDVRVRFGAGNDLQIYHDSSTNKSHITESGSSHLVFQGQEIQFKNASGTSLLDMNAAQCELKFSGSKKLETNTNGIDVTGKLTVDNSTEIDDALVSIKTSTGTVGAIRFYCESSNAHYTELKSAPHSAYSGNLSFQLPASDGSSGQFLKTDGSGNLAFAAAGGGGSPDLFAENYDGSSTKPSATGTNAVGLGKNAVAGGGSSLAAGALSSSAGNLSSAIGFNATVGSSGAYAAAIGQAYANGSDAFAAAIGTNSSSYGATGNGGTTIGYLSKTTSNGYALGKSLVSSGSLSIALGSDATSSAARSVSLGSSNTASHTDAVVIGSGASSSAADEITLGHTDQTVRISSAYTLPQADGSNGEVLTTNGSGALSFAAAGGGDPDLYKDNASSATTPVASGTNALALGNTAVASGENAFAIGSDTDATGLNSLALGKGAQAVSTRCLAIGLNASASADRAISIGNNGNVATATYGTSIGSGSSSSGSTAAGSGSVALSNARAGGSDSFAATITSNTSIYGAIGTNSITIGKLAKASTTGGNAIGWGATSTHEYASAFGVNATTTTSHQVALAGTNHTVLISGAYKLPTADGNANEVLTTNGSGQLSFAAAGGGGNPDLYRDNASSATTPSATGTNAVAIGSASVSSGTDCIAIGTDSSAVQNYAISIGAYSDAAGNNTGMAVGYAADANSTGAMALGRMTVATGDRSSAIGNQAVTNGEQATALTDSYASGADSFAAAIATNSSSYGATGANSIAMGYQSKSTNTYSVAIGNGAQATGNRGYAIGNDSTASGTKSGVFGGDGNTASGASSAAIGGYYANAREKNKVVFGGGYLGVSPGTNLNQSGILPLGAVTTDATATVMRSDNLTAGTTNQVILPNNSAFAFHGTIVARQQAADGTACAAWKVEGLIRREGSAGTTTLVGSTVTTISNTPSWGMSLSADTTNGGLKIEATGASSTDIRWVATVNTSEVTYA